MDFSSWGLDSASVAERSVVVGFRIYKPRTAQRS
jgi:hypothetical protein